jgi:diacylglycerol kinase family enzyme
VTSASFQKIDVGYINERPFFCTAGLGFDAHVSRMFATLKRRGLASYLGLTIREFRQYLPTPVEIEINSAVIRSNCYVLAFANAAQYGNNAMIAPMADIRDGLLDVCLIDELPLRRALRVSVALMTGTLAHSGAAEFHTSCEVRVRSEKPLGYHVDGDFIGESTEHRVRLTPLALEVAT